MKVTTFPQLLNHIRCPFCKQITRAIAVQKFKKFDGSVVEKKWLLPCEHFLNPIEEKKLVEEIFRYGAG